MNGRRLARPGAILLGLLAGVAVLAADGPRPISPGDQATPVGVNTTCPTFSWSGDDRATGYDLAIYRLEGDGALDPSTPMRIAGDARTWTPSVDRCPESGKEYAWAVRALTDGGPGPWSELLLFATPGAPTEDEVRRALALLRQYGREGDVGEGLAPSRGSGREPLAPRQAREDARSSPTPSHPGRAQDPPLRSTTVGPGPAPQVVTTPSSFSMSLDADLDLGGFVFKQGLPFIHNDGGDAFKNTSVGINALISSTPGVPNNGSGIDNSAFGHNSLRRNTIGSFNTAVGSRAMFYNQTGISNTAVGWRALFKNRDGLQNTAVGLDAMFGNTSGSNNTAIGRSAGVNWVSATNSDNIAIGEGVGGEFTDNNVIRIGEGQTKTYIAGINGAPLAGGVSVVIDNHQLGIVSSSARFKQDIHDLGGANERLRRLRPVSFRYKDANSIEYGLVAEEVAEVFPELVVSDEDGAPFTVKYRLLVPLLLAEVQRQEVGIEHLRGLEQEMADLRRRLERKTRKNPWWRK